jgi:hypothetical protein
MTPTTSAQTVNHPARGRRASALVRATHSETLSRGDRSGLNSGLCHVGITFGMCSSNSCSIGRIAIYTSPGERICETFQPGESESSQIQRVPRNTHCQTPDATRSLSATALSSGPCKPGVSWPLNVGSARETVHKSSQLGESVWWSMDCRGFRTESRHMCFRLDRMAPIGQTSHSNSDSVHSLGLLITRKSISVQ